MFKSNGRSLGLILLFFTFLQVLNGQYVAIASGDFDDPTIWSGGVVPPNPIDDDLTINAGVTVNMTESLSIQPNKNHVVTINGELKDNGNGYSLTIGKKTDLVIDGTLDIHTLELEEFSGANQPICDFSANANIILAVLNSGAIINNEGSITVTEAINQTGGIINNTGSILAENFTNDGSITNDGDGSIVVSGTLTNNGTVTNNAPQNNFVVSILINNGTINGNGIIVSTLPIHLKLLEAKAINGIVEIAFEVEDIFGVSAYQIDHSTDGKHFALLLESDVLPSATFNNEITLKHLEPGKCRNYYALYALDQDGERTFLRMTTVDLLDKQSFDPEIFVQKGVLNIRIAEEQDHNISVFDMNGRLLHIVNSKEKQLRLDLQHLDSGMYVVQVENGIKRKAKKVFINR